MFPAPIHTDVGNDVDTINDFLLQLWALAQGRYVALAVAAVIVLAAITPTVWWMGATRLKLAGIWIASNLALLLNAEGTWHVLTAVMHLPHLFAALVMAVFELAFLVAMGQATINYRRTGTPGPGLYVAWFIALASGVVVASAATTPQEVLLRLVVPVVAMLIAWVTRFTDKARRSAFAFTPSRLAERWGWLTSDLDPDIERLTRERRTRSLVLTTHRVRSSDKPSRRSLRRLWRLALTADEVMVSAVSAQLARADSLVALALTAPSAALIVEGTIESAPADDERSLPSVASAERSNEHSDALALIPLPSGTRGEALGYILDMLALGREVTGPMVAARFGGGQSTARRWVSTGSDLYESLSESAREQLANGARERMSALESERS